MFVLNWRLKKHEELHEINYTRKCHYFNNQKVCPFEEFGCMFLHEDSGICKYGEKCNNKLCPYKHPELVRQENSDDHTNNHSETENENIWECQVDECDFKSVLYSDYWGHIDNNHLEN